MMYSRITNGAQRCLLALPLLCFLFPSMAQVPSVVERFGKLRTAGNRLVDGDGNPATLRGMSLYWSQWTPEFYNADCVRWRRDDWRCTVVRAAMGVEDTGCIANPQREMAKVVTVVEACVNLGIYVVVDWHDHHAEEHQSEAIEFFQSIATRCGHLPNLIYEIYNEPETSSWTSVKAYAETVIAAIRAIDPDDVIIVGTPTWSQDVDIAGANPVNGDNLCRSGSGGKPGRGLAGFPAQRIRKTHSGGDTRSDRRIFLRA